MVGRHIDHYFAGYLSKKQTILAGQDLADRLAVKETDEYNFRFAGKFRKGSGFISYQALGFSRRSIPDSKLMPAIEQSSGYSPAKMTKSDKS
jgi:hypothetical protein